MPALRRTAASGVGQYALACGKGRVSRAWYNCHECGAEIDEHQKPAMLAAGKWQAHNPDGLWRSYHINALYAPIGIGENWCELAERWLLAQNDLTKLIAFINTVLGETWADRSRDIKPNVLLARAEPYDLRTVPPGCLVITAGVDVQDDRLEIRSPAGAGMIAVGHSTTTSCPAARATTSCGCGWRNTSTAPHSKTAAAKPCASKPPASTPAATTPTWSTPSCAAGAIKRAIACKKGASTPGRIILGKPSKQDVNLRGQTLKKGVSLYLVGTDTAKGAALRQTARRHR